MVECLTLKAFWFSLLASVLLFLLFFQNTLELTLFDEDVLLSDELTSVVFDVTGMVPGRRVKNTFKLKEVSLLP